MPAYYKITERSVLAGQDALDAWEIVLDRVNTAVSGKARSRVIPFQGGLTKLIGFAEGVVLISERDGGNDVFVAMGWGAWTGEGSGIPSDETLLSVTLGDLESVTTWLRRNQPRKGKPDAKRAAERAHETVLNLCEDRHDYGEAGQPLWWMPHGDEFDGLSIHYRRLLPLVKEVANG